MASTSVVRDSDGERGLKALICSEAATSAANDELFTSSGGGAGELDDVLIDVIVDSFPGPEKAAAELRCLRGRLEM